ncbi:hypothetical protein T265_07707 [Opisthorchis viverrini]|uniref:Uncharacterized protein n=1 Tax=Opisthorchis viverrini TaxID=6198 RepID=A0A074ZBQ4_OPIVI|nr:hypothetical protein T265_07707 [Opisthorchis viverrini]KER24711.1 hypothetical protein T265_07707 [Opisthorchis viverrini]
MSNLQKIIIPVGLIAYLLCGTLAAILPRFSEDKRGAYLDLPWGKRSSVFEHIPPERVIWDEELRPIMSQHKRGAYIDLPWGRHTTMSNLQKIIIPVGLIAYLLCGTLAAILPRFSEDKRGAYLDLPWGKRSSVFEHIPPERVIWDEELRPIMSQHKRGAYIDLPWGR